MSGEVDVLPQGAGDTGELDIIVIDEIPLDPEPMSREEAEELALALEEAAEMVVELAVRAWVGQAWRVLGLASWQDFAADKLRYFRQLRLGSDRVRAQRELRAAGMSQQAVGEVFGVSQASVSRSEAKDPDARRPASTTGLDGKTRRAKSAAKERPPRRKLVDEFFMIFKLLIRDGERLKRLMRDDRWRENRLALAEKYESDLARVLELLTELSAEFAEVRTPATTDKKGKGKTNGE